MQISEAGFFFDGSLWKAGDTGLSGEWIEILLWGLYDCVYQLLFAGVEELPAKSVIVEDRYSNPVIAETSCYCSLVVSRELFFVSEGYRKPRDMWREFWIVNKYLL